MNVATARRPATLMSLCYHSVVRRSQYHIAVTMGARMATRHIIKGSRAPQQFERWDRDRRPNCYKRGKLGHLQVDSWETKLQREGC